MWSEETTSKLQDCFESTEWEMFAQGVNLEEHTASVLGYINFFTETVTS